MRKFFGICLTYLFVMVYFILLPPTAYASTWTTSSLYEPAANVGNYTTLTLDSNGFARIIYNNASDNTLEYLACNDAHCTASTRNNLGLSASAPYAIVQGQDGFSRILYVDETNVLKLLICQNAPCTSHSSTSLTSGQHEFSNASIEIGNDNFPRITYSVTNDIELDVSEGDVRFVQCTNTDCTTTVITNIDGSEYSDNSTMQLGADGFARIAYTNWDDATLRYVQCANASCSTRNTNILDTGDIDNGIEFNSLQIGSDGFVRVAYHSYPNIKLAVCSNDSCSSPTVTTISALGDAGNILMLRLRSDDIPRIAYQRTPDYDLRYASCSDVTCSSASVVTVDATQYSGGHLGFALGSANEGYIAYQIPGTYYSLSFAYEGPDPTPTPTPTPTPSPIVPHLSSNEHFQLIKDINPGTGFSVPSGYSGWSSSKFTRMNGKLFFTASDGVHGQELWVTDGTEAGTTQVKDINSGSGSSLLSSMFASGNILYFSASDSSHGWELWKSDGTEAGTILVKDIFPGAESSNPGWFYDLNGVILFAASDDSGTSYELWKTDGTESGTTLIKDIYPGTDANGISISYGPQFIEYNSELYFFGNDAGGTGLWKTDGTTEGTVRIGQYEIDLTIRPAVLPNGIVFAVTLGEYGNEPWYSDGTSGNTHVIANISSAGNSISDISDFKSFTGKVYFAANDDTNGYELWRTDGTGEGTQLVKDISAGAGSSNPSMSEAVEYDSKLFFGANDGSATDYDQLWTTDGTTEGTQLVKDIARNYAGADTTIYFIGEVGGNLLFSVYDSTNFNRLLWKTDGTASGTIPLSSVPIASIEVIEDRSQQILSATQLLLNAYDDMHNYELWSYWVDTPTPTPTPTSGPPGPRPEGQRSTTDTPTCNERELISVPDLFQITTSRTTATVYFSPISDIHSYYLAFGRTAGSEEYGTDLTYSDTSGVLAYQITHLQPNTTYFVKLRGSRGCKPGSWSNSIRFTTARSGSRLFYKDLISQVISAFSNSTANAQTPSKLGTTAKVKTLSSCAYTVRPGDNLWDIATRVLGNGTLYRKIIQLNKLPSDSLNPGQKLKVC